MKFFSVTFFFGFIGLFVHSQQSRVDYILKYQSIAIDEMNRSGIPASITMAQACLESADGLSSLSQMSNNHFGIKCKSDWMGEKVYFDDDAKNECFRKYSSVEESYVDHTDFLLQNPRYRSLFDLGSTNYKGWAKGLKDAGYATLYNYDKKLIEIIENFQLHKLDSKITIDAVALFPKRSVSKRFESGTTVINAFDIHRVTPRNGIKSIVAIEGDTYDKIAQEFGLEVWELCKFNDQPRDYVPQRNEVIYLKLKKYRSSKSKSIHKADDGDTMHYISQLYGIRLRPLLIRNNMKSGEQPFPGQTISLRKKLKRY